jgi:hypothetical protein
MVKEGNVSADLVKSELSRLIQVKWNWSIQKHEDGFLVPFPCSVELQRMISMKYVHTLGGEGILVIQEVNQKIEPISYLQKAWVNVYGVPFEISSFLPLWAIGTISGATEKVDMRYTKKMGLVRILVAVTNVNHIPESAEIVVGEWLYEIFFKVDKVLIEGKWMDNDNMGNRDGDDKEQGEDEDYSKKHENDSLQLEELAEDTVMEDNSLHGDSKKPQDGACDMGLVSQLENQIVNGSVTGTGIDPEGLSLGMPTDLMALTSSLDDQYVVTHTPGALDQSLGCGSSDGKSNSWLMQYPRCSSLASVSQGEVEWTLSVPATSRLFLNETTYLSGVAAGMDVEDVCAQPKVVIELDDDHIKSTGNLLIHHNFLPVSPSLFNIPYQVSDHSVTLSFESNIQERGSYLGHVNSFAGVPRSILQVLCKEFNIKANTKNDDETSSFHKSSI